MFAVITPALILGAFAERMKFSTFCVFMLIWATFVYDPICHWVWAVGGFIGNMGAIDFAGGTVVHINAGVAALVCSLVLGKRQGYPGKISPPHNLPFAVLGAGFLWFGWFGFNAGSALGANGLAASAFLSTHVAASAAGLTWAILDWRINAHATVLGMITGVVAGLVAITPAAGFVGPIDAIWIGIGAAIACYFFVAVVKVKLGTTTRSMCSACTASAVSGAPSPPGFGPARKSTLAARTAFSTATRASSWLSSRQCS